MRVFVREYVPSRQVRATGSDWYNLYDTVKKIAEQHPDEEVILDFDGVYPSYNSESNYATNIAALKNVKVVLYNDRDLCEVLRTVAIMKGKDKDSVVNVVKEIKHDTITLLSAKEKAQLHEKELIEQFVDGTLVMKGVFRLDLQYWRSNEINSITSKSRADMLCDALFDCVKRRIDSGTPINKVFVHANNFQIAEFALEKIAKMTPEYRALGCELHITSDDVGIEDKMRLLTEIGVTEASDEVKVGILRQLGLGRVGLLTKFKHRRTDNIERRLDNEIANQYIAIIIGIKAHEVLFRAILTFDIASNRWDEFSRCGEDNKPVIDSVVKAIKLCDIGFERACIGKTWHFNTFDGTATGIKFRETICNEHGGYGDHVERVCYPEYVRRTLLAYGIKFDNDKLIEDCARFEADANRVDANKNVN